jgi:hypothetical protein
MTVRLWLRVIGEQPSSPSPLYEILAGSTTLQNSDRSRYTVADQF